MRARRLARLVTVSLFLLLPAAAWAQSSISGVVRDASGGVLPGVTVEAASPALIEGVRSGVSDSQGVYGANWKDATQILSGRLLRLGVQFDF